METHAQDPQLSRRRFRIGVAGRLDERFLDGTEEIEMGNAKDGSTLDGMLIDQSQLRGILDRLWRLGIEVLRFETYRADLDKPDTQMNSIAVPGRQEGSKP